MAEKCYLFDFDGTLVDSMEYWAGVHMDTLKKAGIPVPENFVETITPLGNYHGSKYTLSLGINIPLEEYLEDVNRKLYHAYTTHIGLKSNVREALEGLRQQNISLNVLTASPHLYVDPCLQRAGIYDLFDNVWTIDDFGLTKGQGEIYHQVAQRLDTDIARCTMVDDNLTVISTAKAAGMGTIAVYDSTSDSAQAAMKEIADRYIYDFKELCSTP